MVHIWTLPSTPSSTALCLFLTFSVFRRRGNLFIYTSVTAMIGHLSFIHYMLRFLSSQITCTVCGPLREKSSAPKSNSREEQSDWSWKNSFWKVECQSFRELHVSAAYKMIPLISQKRTYPGLFSLQNDACVVMTKICCNVTLFSSNALLPNSHCSDTLTLQCITVNFLLFILQHI